MPTEFDLTLNSLQADCDTATIVDTTSWGEDGKRSLKGRTGLVLLVFLAHGETPVSKKNTDQLLGRL